MNKLYYNWENYELDVAKIHGELVEGHTPYFVSVHRGSLPIGVKLSNKFNTPLSVIKFQTRDGEDKEPVFAINEIPSKDSKVIVLDDIFDTGLTLSKIKDFLSEYTNVHYYVIHNNKAVEKVSDVEVLACNDTNGEWVVYPWE